MPNRQYQQGTRFEHKIQEVLEAEGWGTARTAGSKGAMKIDIVAVHLSDHRLMFIQAKRTGTIGPAEWNTLLGYARAAGAVAVLAENGPQGRGVTFWRMDATAVVRQARARSLYDVRARGTVEA